MIYRLKVWNTLSGEVIHTEECNSLVDMFKASEKQIDKLIEDSIRICCERDGQVIFQHNGNSRLAHAYTKNFKDLPRQELYSLKSHWLEIAYNLHNDCTDSFLRTFQNEYRLPGDLSEIRFTDGNWISVDGQNIVGGGGELDFNLILTNKGLKVILTEESSKVTILNYKLEDIQEFVFYDFRNNCEFKYTKE